MCSTSMLPYRMVVPGGAGRMILSQGVPSINLVGIVAIMAPLSRSSGPVVTSQGRVWVRTSLRGDVPSGGGE